MNNYQNKTIEYITMIDEFLENAVKHNNDSYKIVKQAAEYSLMAGGKRIRPILTLEFCRVNGGDIRKALPFACAVEMIHTYSLIHDDLPCMDNDDYRRGRLSCHKKFGEANALLAGDGLLTLAFNLIGNANKTNNTSLKACVEATVVLSRYAGMDGMVGGQIIDLENENRTITEKQLNEIHSLKTSALLKAACALGVLAADGNEEKLKRAESYGEYLGLAFQTVDDILSETSEEKILGKPIKNDEGKTTYITLYSIEKAKEKAKEYTENALNMLEENENNNFLIELTKEMLKRDK